MATMARPTVAAVYTRPDGARVLLTYRETAHGTHRVVLHADEVAVWVCATVEGARARWSVLARRLRGGGFALQSPHAES